METTQERQKHAAISHFFEEVGVFFSVTWKGWRKIAASEGMKSGQRSAQTFSKNVCKTRYIDVAQGIFALQSSFHPNIYIWFQFVNVSQQDGHYVRVWIPDDCVGIRWESWKMEHKSCIGFFLMASHFYDFFLFMILLFSWWKENHFSFDVTYSILLPMIGERESSSQLSIKNDIKLSLNWSLRSDFRKSGWCCCLGPVIVIVIDRSWFETRWSLSKSLIEGD